MIPIRNQPIAFPTYNASPTQDGCSQDCERKPLKFKPTDPIRVQWLRETAALPTNCELISPELITQLITNGDFTDGDTGWTYDTGDWDFTGGVATSLAGNGMSQIPGLVLGKSYLLTYTVVIPSTQTVTPYLGGLAYPGTTRTASGTYSEVLTYSAGFDVFQIVPSAAGVILDDISLSEVIEANDCWTFPGWDYTTDGLVHQDGQTGFITYSGLTVGQHYKLKIESTVFDQGILLIRNDTQLLGMHSNDQDTYYFIAVDANVTFEPSADFNGTISKLNFYEHDYFAPDDVIVLAGTCDVTIDLGGNLSNSISYYKDYATLSFFAEDFGMDDCCGYEIQFTTGGTDYVSVPFEINSNPGCYWRWVESYCDCDGWGFNYHDYKHGMRVPFNFTSPEYDFDDKEKTLSNGVHPAQTDERGKSWLCKTQDATIMDEAFHDAFSVMLHCTHVSVDGFNVFCPDKTYTPQWPETGYSEIAPVSFNLNAKTDTIFKRNAGCYPQQYFLRVLAGWTTPDYFKVMDGYKTNYLGTIFRCESILINGEQMLDQIEYFTLDSVSTTPTGINGNLVHQPTKGAGISYEIPQSVSDWINGLLEAKRVPMQFFDDLSVVYYREDIDFEISISANYTTLAVDYSPFIFTNAGKRIDEINYSLDYVA